MESSTRQPPQQHWTEEIADGVLRRVRAQRGEKNFGNIVCASGISPSGPVHLGNAREILTAHFVAEELRARGHSVTHVHFWDDYDRFRKVPEGVPLEEFQEYLGKPLCDVPDPCCEEHSSYAEHFADEFVQCLAELGVNPTFVWQSEVYRRGDYNEMCRIALANRSQIFDILSEIQSEALQTAPVAERRIRFYPFRVYCQACGKDTTEIRSYEEPTATIHYTCRCNHENSFSLFEANHGKLAWKVDWPMRWHQARVDFEPGGEDHTGSSFVVGQKIARSVFGTVEPHYVSYAFVGMSGSSTSKMSSSAGGAATPRAALDIFEPAVLRWLYLRRRPNKAFSIDFGKAMFAIYDEWDRLAAMVDSGEAADEHDAKVVARCRVTSSGTIVSATIPVSFRVLTAAADIAQGNEDVMLRITRDHVVASNNTPPTREAFEPRFGCAARWATRHMPEQERTVIRESFSREAWAGIAGEQREGIAMLLNMLADHWSLDGLNVILYGVPKMQAGLDVHATNPSKELKRSQRQFFVAIYRLLLCSSRETGPRLPTLFLALGQNRGAGIAAATSTGAPIVVREIGELCAGGSALISIMLSF